MATVNDYHKLLLGFICLFSLISALTGGNYVFKICVFVSNFLH